MEAERHIVESSIDFHCSALPQQMDWFGRAVSEVPAPRQPPKHTPPHAHYAGLGSPPGRAQPAALPQCRVQQGLALRRPGRPAQQGARAPPLAVQPPQRRSARLPPRPRGPAMLPGPAPLHRRPGPPLLPAGSRCRPRPRGRRRCQVHGRPPRAPGWRSPAPRRHPPRSARHRSRGRWRRRQPLRRLQSSHAGVPGGGGA